MGINKQTNKYTVGSGTKSSKALYKMRGNLNPVLWSCFKKEEKRKWKTKKAID